MPAELNPVWNEKFYLWVNHKILDVSFVLDFRVANVTYHNFMNTEQVDSSNITSDFYFGGGHFKSQLGHWLFWLRFFMICLTSFSLTPV
jgi:hypothetical protein